MQQNRDRGVLYGGSSVVFSWSTLTHGGACDWTRGRTALRAGRAVFSGTTRFRAAAVPFLPFSSLFLLPLCSIYLSHPGHPSRGMSALVVHLDLATCSSTEEWRFEPIAVAGGHRGAASIAAVDLLAT